MIIVGPTAVGKTAVSLEMARRVDAEIVSADSRQIYRYMDIGTAKPTPQERAVVPHHFIDIRNPDEHYSAGQFAREARAVIENIRRRGRLPVVVGGSGLYTRGLVDGFFDPRVTDQRVKRMLQNRVRREGLQTLYRELQRADPETAGRLPPGDTQRILRALEVYEITGEPFSSFLKRGAQPADFEPVFRGLRRPRARLYARIEERVDRMLAEGFLQEVRALRERGYGPELNALKTVGYREANLYLDGQIDYPRMVALMKQKTRNYAKRQMTWFRKDRRIRWLDIDVDHDLERLAGRLLAPIADA